MKTLFFECNMGAAGDMLMSALLEIHPNPQDFIKRLNDLNIPNVNIVKKSVTKCGIVGTGVDVLINGEEEDDSIYEHSHSHKHHHEHNHNENNHHHHSDHSHHNDHNHSHHHHTGINEVREIIAELNLPEKIRKDALSVYNLLAEAESHAHGKPVEQIHFHEIGTMDAMADIVGVCMLINEIAPDKIYTSHIHVGSGQVRCAHGILHVPAPATEHILQGAPTYGGEVKGELCTPTGAALLKYFTDEFVTSNNMVVLKTGYGMGKKHFYSNDGTEILSAVRAMLGESKDDNDNIIMLSCNVDDMTGEQIGFAMDIFLSEGAAEVYTTAVGMKKNRPGTLITLLCKPDLKEKMIKLIFKHTTTIGIREVRANRYILERKEEIVETKYGNVRVKCSTGYGITRKKAEYDDISKIAKENKISLWDIE